MKRQHLLACLFVWIQALVIWRFCGLFAVALIVSLATGAALCGARVSIKQNIRIGLYCIFACAQFIRYQNFHSGLGGGDEPGAWSFFIAEFLLLIQAVELLRKRTHDEVARSIPSLGVVTLACAFNQNVVVQDRKGFLLIGIVAVIAVSLLHRHRHMLRTETRWRRFVMTASLATVAIFAWVFEEHWPQSVTSVQGWFNNQAAAAIRRKGVRLYVRSATLRSVAFEQTTDPDSVALRVFSDSMPGYLRGRVYDTYYNARWHDSQGRLGRRSNKWSRLNNIPNFMPLAAVPAGLPRSENGKNVFALNNQASEPWKSVEIWNDPRRGEMYFTPLGTTHVRGDATMIAVDAHQVVHAGLKTKEPYTAFVPQQMGTVELTGHQRSRLIIQPFGLEARVAKLARTICADANTTAEKIAAVESFFRANYEYSLDGFKTPNDTDPLSHFLLRRPSAHCEFFASGAIALLRLENVPCRYVTGYVATELESEYGDYWVARNRNAHAWAEAYDDQRQRWVIVEATPGVHVPRTLMSGSDANADATDDGNQLEEVLSLDYPILSLRWLWLRFLILIELTSQPVFFLLATLLLAWLVYNKVQTPSGDQVDRNLAKFHALLRQMDRRLRRHQLIRDSSETLRQFALRIRAAAKNDEQLARIADWYETYIQARYNGQLEIAAVPQIQSGSFFGLFKKYSY